MNVKLQQIIFFIIIVLVSSCLTSEPDPHPDAIPPTKKNTTEGTIKMEGSVPASLMQHHVVSYESEGPVEADLAFKVDTVGLFSTSFLGDDEGNIFLMRFNYPGQPDNDLSPESTALAFLMNLPLMSSLAPAGQLKLINDIQSTDEFAAVAKEVSTIAAAGKAVTDEDNLALHAAIRSMFVRASSMRKAGNKNPIIIKTADPGTVSLMNNGVGHTYVAGVYKDGNWQRLEKLEISGTDLLASSVSDLIAGYFGEGYSDVDQQIFSTTEEGKFEFHIRSGKPLEDDNSLENREAKMINVNLYAIGLVLKFVPMPVENKCFSTVLDGVRTSVFQNVEIQQAKNAGELTNAVIDQVSDLFMFHHEIIGVCKPNFVPSRYYKLVGKLFSVFSLVAGTFDAVNQTKRIIDLFSATPAIDTCFQMLNKQVIPCYPITLRNPTIAKVATLEMNTVLLCSFDQVLIEAYNAYYFGFDYDDPKNLIAADLSNLSLYIQSELACYNQWRPSSYHFEGLPLIWGGNNLRYPVLMGMPPNGSGTRFTIQFYDSNTGEAISNPIDFVVERGVNYP